MEISAEEIGIWDCVPNISLVANENTFRVAFSSNVFPRRSFFDKRMLPLSSFNIETVCPRITVDVDEPE